MNEEQEEYLLSLLGLLLSKYIQDTGDIHFHRVCGAPAEYQKSKLKIKLKELEDRVCDTYMENRFKLNCTSNIEFIMQNRLTLPIRDKTINKDLKLDETVELLNRLNDENQELNNLKNLCNDYNLKLEDIYTIVEDAIERGLKE